MTEQKRQGGGKKPAVENPDVPPTPPGEPSPFGTPIGGGPSAVPGTPADPDAIVVPPVTATSEPAAAKAASEVPETGDVSRPAPPAEPAGVAEPAADPETTTSRAPKPVPAEPETPEELRADRDRAREELGATISELSDRVDVPARAEAKLHETTESAKHRAAEVADAAKQRAHQTAEAAKHRATQAKTTVTNAAPSLSEPLDDVRKQVAESTRRNRVPVIAATAGSAALITWIVLRRRRS
ncbi:DUF3618 domain-containing protein [Nocardia takedensis]